MPEQAMQEASFEFEGTRVAYHRVGEGRPLLLLHGSGPGASSMGNWRTVLPALSSRFEVFAVDLVGFGKSGRKPAPPYFDFGMWVRQAQAMLDRIRPGEQVGVVGHSISAAIALTLASRDPRVAAVATTGAMGAPFTTVEQTLRVWTCPRNRAELVAALSGIIHDARVIDDAYLAAREPVIFAPGYADYFDAMFEGDKQRYADAAVLAPETLRAVRCPVLLIHGREDLAFPASTTLALAQQLPLADVALLAGCSHSVAFERTSTFVALVEDHFGRHLG
jgi:2-hydroxymuconate-semialdehyde hydrolase